MTRTLLDFFLNYDLKDFDLVCHRGDEYCGGIFIVSASDGQFAATIADNLVPQSIRAGIDKATYVISPNYTHIRPFINKAVESGWVAYLA